MLRDVQYGLHVSHTIKWCDCSSTIFVDLIIVQHSHDKKALHYIHASQNYWEELNKKLSLCQCIEGMFQFSLRIKLKFTLFGSFVRM